MRTQARERASERMSKRRENDRKKVGLCQRRLSLRLLHFHWRARYWEKIYNDNIRSRKSPRWKKSSRVFDKFLTIHLLLLQIKIASKFLFSFSLLSETMNAEANNISNDKYSKKKIKKTHAKKWELIANGSAKTIISIKRAWVDWAWGAKEFPFHVMALFNHFLLLADLHLLLCYRFLSHAIVVVFTTTLFLTLYYENVHGKFFFSEKRVYEYQQIYMVKKHNILFKLFFKYILYIRNVSFREYLRFVLSSRDNFRKPWKNRLNQTVRISI